MIYTNIDNLKLNVKTKSYKKLGSSFVEWIENTCLNLYKNRNIYENKASDILKKLKVNFEPQCLFFDSKTKSTYFLDFLLIDSKIALEIDGESHKYKVLHDKNRDLFFKKIGIKTIRIKNENVCLSEIKKAINNSIIIHKYNDNQEERISLENIKSMINIHNKKYNKKVRITL